MGRRIESDSLGEVEVDSDRYWGAQTERALANFPIGGERMPMEVVLAIALIKKAAAFANGRLGVLEGAKVEAILAGCDAILSRNLDGHFPLPVWQTGSGTQTNMNVNEVVANLASEAAGLPLGSKRPLHPNDDVNRSQSSNDVFPSAMQVSTALALRDRLLPAARSLRGALGAKAVDFAGIVKTGRTHLQDAVPVTLGQEFAAYAEQLRLAIGRIEAAGAELLLLPLGGTAVGTGLNSPGGFAELAIAELGRLTGLALAPAPDRLAKMAAHDDLVALSGALASLAAALTKIANDLRLLGSGPTAGLGELRLPANEPGSSIMPGKVNPTQIEALTMASIQVLGYNAAVAFAGASGQLELNAYKPLIIHDVLSSIDLLSASMASFEARCLRGIEANRERIGGTLARNPMLATALAPAIGYDRAAAIAHEALAGDLGLREVAVGGGHIGGEEFDRLADPARMAEPQRGVAGR